MNGETMWSVLTLVPVAVPGLLMATQGVMAERRMDLGVVGRDWEALRLDLPGMGPWEKAKKAVMLVAYFSVMPVWAIFIPIYR